MRLSASLAAATTAVVLAVSGAALLPAAASAAGPAPAAARGSNLSPGVERESADLAKGSTIRVIATFKAAGGIGKRPDTSAIKASRTEVLAGLPRGSYDVVASFSRIPAVSLEVDATALETLARDPQVLSVQKDHVVTTTMTEANELTGANAVHDLDITGEGLTAAIIDTGVDSAGGVVHPGLADDLAGQQCFRTENDCIGGAASAEDQDGHGTHVAGMITGPEGVAPDARFYALKVFTTGDTSDTNILNALNHVIGLNSTPGTVDLVNMSLGGDNFGDAASCNANNSAYQTAFATLNSQSVTVFVATGNDASTSSVGAPACVDGSVGVGSTGDDTFNISFSSCTDNAAPDKVSCYSNATPVQGAGELVDLLAPGCLITSLGLDNGTAADSCGTSMATPYAVGVAALVQEYAEAHAGKLSPSALETLLEETGKPVTDYRIAASPTYPRVAPLDAIGQLAIPAPTNLLVTGTTATSVSLSWTAAAGADHYQLTRTDAASGTTTDIPTVGAGTTFTDTSAPCGQLTYSVRAVDGGGIPSQASNEVTTSARACPATPGSVALVDDDADTHTIGWTLAGTFTNVVLQRRPAGGAFADFQTLAGSAVSYQDTVVACGRVDYRVLTVAANGDRSAPSAVVGRSMCAPLNDDLADAEVVTVGAIGATVTDTEPNARYGSVEATDPAYSCHFGGPATGFDGVWYQITPAADSRVTVSTGTSTITDPAAGVPDTLLAIYKGTPSAGNEVACNDDISGSNFRSTAVSNLLSGNTYWVHVSQWTDVPDSATGSLITTFTWAAPIIPPANDDFADAAALAPPTQTVTSAQNATLQSSDPLHECAFNASGSAIVPRTGTHTLWWTFTPDVGGTLDLDTLASSGSFTDTIMSVYTGSPGSFTTVACNDDEETSGTSLRSELVDVPLTAGTTYSILVSRWSTTPTTTAGTVVLTSAFTATPGVTLSTSAVAVEEGRPGVPYTARLNAQPTGDVTLTPTGDADCSVSAPLTFTTADWATPQVVTVTAVDDGAAEPEESCTVSHAVTSADAAYNGVAVGSVTGTVTDKLVTSITLASPAEGASYVQGAAVAADFTCNDNRTGAGITSCVGTVADGAAIDTAALGSHTFTVTLTDVHGGVTTETNTYTVTAAPVVTTGKPDARIKSPAPLVGDNVYGGTKQKKKVKAALGTKVTYVVSLQNDGTGADRLKVLGGKTVNGFKMKYVGPDGTNITKAVVGGTFLTPSLAKNGTYDIKVVVKVTKKAVKKAKISVRATSVTTPTASDVVFMLTKKK